jgi:ABC-type nitrate/sulfonate/bicarbonate transport system substrate-binding protein
MVKAFALVSLLLTFSVQAADVRVALVSRTVFNMPLWMAQEKGYLKAEGIDATLEILNNAEKINEDLRSGRAQVALATPESVVLDAYRGGSLRIIGGNAERLPHFIITQPRIKSLRELKGAKFGVLSLQEGTTYLVHELARQIGLGKGDYEVLAVGGAPTRWKLLQAGKIDAGLQPFPLSYEAEDAGFNNLGPISNFVRDYLFTSINVDRNWSERNRDTTKAFMRAMKRGQAAIAAEPAEAVAVAAKELNTSAALAKRALDDTAKLKILSEDLSVNEAALAGVFETLKSARLLPAESKFELGRIVDASYLK